MRVVAEFDFFVGRDAVGALAVTFFFERWLATTFDQNSFAVAELHLIDQTLVCVIRLLAPEPPFKFVDIFETIALTMEDPLGLTDRHTLHDCSRESNPLNQFSQNV